MIDDSEKTIREINETGIRGIMFKSISNTKAKLDCESVYNWLELESKLN